MTGGDRLITTTANNAAAPGGIVRSEFYLAEGERLAHIGSWALDPGGFFDYWSRELFYIFGLDETAKAPTLQEYLGLVHPNDREFVARTIETMLAEHSGCDFTKRIVRPDGELRYVRCVGVPLIEQGAFHGFIGTAIDITEHELLTQELRRREVYLAEAQKLSHTGSFGWNVRSGQIYWSDETFRIFEYDHATKPTVDLVVQRVHPEDRAGVRQVIDRASRDGTDFEHGYRLQMPDGRIRHLQVVARALQDPSGVREFVGAVTDVTSIRIAEEALRLTYDQLQRSQAYLAEAQKLTHTGSWAYAPARKKTLYWSEEIFRIFGLDPQQGIPHYDETKRLVHPDDLARVSEECLNGFREKAQFSQHYRLLLRDGTVKHLHVIWHPVLDKGGELVEYIGTAADVTERKRAEETIREQETELRHILDLTPQFVGVFGPDHRRLYANRSALTYFGVTLEQWQDISDRFHFFHPDDRERVTAEADNMFSSGAAHEFEARLRRGDGSYRWFLIRFNPLHDEQGRITRWHLAGMDIEDRKRAEERLLNENVALREEISKASMFEQIVGTSPALQTVLSRVSKVAPTGSTVLITGETGTGKELVARAIHRRSQRCSRPFVGVNCAATPRDLIASELFGHEKGAFTGALQRRLGRFELAEGGTIFLDEIGELPAETQIALLRVLQEHEFERVGGSQAIRTDVRVVAATNCDLQAAISAGTFRSDLFYRLNVFPIEIPPLRARRGDVALLVEYFIDRFARETGKKIRSIDKKTLELLQTYPWPGNIRELQNVIERSIILCETEIFSVDESWLLRDSSSLPAVSPTPSKKLVAQDKEIIEAALTETKGRVSGSTGAAAKLGIPSTTLESKIKSLKINKHHFKGN